MDAAGDESLKAGPRAAPRVQPAKVRLCPGLRAEVPGGNGSNQLLAPCHFTQMLRVQETFVDGLNE